MPRVPGLRRGRARRAAAGIWAVAAASTVGCSVSDPPRPEPLPPNSFAFGVFGDAPYQIWEQGRYRRLLADVGRADIAWLIHVGDLFWYPCSDEEYGLRLREMNAIPHPVAYTPGDNEWTDCHHAVPGRRDPLERLAALRRTFFARPGLSLGATPLAIETQATDPAFAEFPENVRWRRGGFVFATVHVVGSDNGMEDFDGRTPASDAESARRMRAAQAWTHAAFAAARAARAKGVVLAFHAEIGLDPTHESRAGYEPLIAQLQHEAAAFDGQVIVIHGDSHQARTDHPPVGPNGSRVDRFTRIETFGSPDVGWMRVVLDTAAGRVVRVEPRLFRGGW